MAYGKGAVAKLNSGKTAFVFGGVPREVCEVEVVEDFDRYCTARIVSRNVKADSIPGANWADLPYEVQLREKKAIVRDALLRNAKFKEDIVDKVLKNVVASEAEWNYRNKIELAYANSQIGMIDQSSNEFVEVNSFPLAHKSIEGAPKALAGALKFALHGQDYGLFRVGVRHSDRTNETQVALWTTPGWFPRHEVAKIISDALDVTSIVRIIASEGKTRKIKQVEVLDGAPTWSEKLQGFRYQLSAPSFFQVNTSQAEVLQQHVISSLISNPSSLIPEKVVDLYCGAGTFTLPLAKEGFGVVGVELAGSSTRDLKVNLEKNNLKAKIVCDEVERALPSLDNFDACVVDPPKCGLNKGVIKSLIKKSPKQIVYVSCDPMTLARDLQKLCSAGYSLEKVTPVDMFPQTHHIETVVSLTRKG